jgi:conjugative relaxase-like TrwC/TraI family protein
LDVSPQVVPSIVSLKPVFLFVIASVTVLGARGRSASAVAADVVAYLEGQRPERGGSRAQATSKEPTALPSPAGGVAAYYADSAGGGPGTWLGRGAQRMELRGEVDSTDLRAVLEGKDPHDHESFVAAAGSAGRTDAPLVRMDARSWWSLREASAVAGVSPAYLRRLADRTQVAVGERVMALMTGQAIPPGPTQWLVAEKAGKRWRVSRDELADYMNGRKPPTVVVGYDVTFSVEKSVSALWARAEDDVRSEIIAAVDASVTAGADYLDRHALRVRVKGTRHEARGMIAASYLHSTSRALDPQLHRHVVIANVAGGPDGQMRALDGMSLFHHAKTAGYVAGAELRHQLTARLGVEWSPVVRGLSEIAGVGEEAIAAISTRSHEMAAAALAVDAESQGAVPTHSAASRQALALATRAAKTGGVDPEALRSRWRETLETAGLDAEAFARALHRVTAPSLIRAEEVTDLFAWLGGAHGVTEMQAAFDRRHVVQAVSEWAVDRLSAAACEDLADRWLASPEVVPLHSTRRRNRSGEAIYRHGGTVVRAGGEQQFSTRAILAIETRIETNYERGRDLGRAVVPGDLVKGVLAQPAFAHLSGEQQDLVRHLTTSGHETTLVHGPAGTGKTTAIEAASRAWEVAGYRVLGVSVNGNAAEVLGRAAGIESSTVASLLWRLTDGGPGVLDDRSVVVLDEATTLATRDLDRLLSEVHEHGATLNLVGDPVQHSAVGAGGAFRWLVENYPGDVARLTINRRQVGEHLSEVRLALDEYRSGAIRGALARLETNQRVVTADSASELFDSLVADWYVDRQRTRDAPAFERSSMTAAHHDERRALVDRARALLLADGTLHGREMSVSGTTYCAGDEVIAKLPDRSLRPAGGDRQSFVKNGSRGTVVTVADDHLVVDFEHRGEITIPRSYLDQDIGHGAKGALLHSYCLTTYAAQGDTYGAARHLGSDHSTRAELYVGLTRGRHDVALYAVRRHEVVAPIVDDDLPQLTDDTNAARAMASSAAAGGFERLATEVDPLANEAATLASRLRVPEIMAMVERADDSTLPLARATYEIATRHIVGRAIAEPSEAVLRVLGQCPEVEDESGCTVPENSPRGSWGKAVGAVALYQSAHPAGRFPSTNPTDELIGLRALSPDPESWDRVDASVQQFIDIATKIEIVNEQLFDLQIDLGL